MVLLHGNFQLAQMSDYVELYCDLARIGAMPWTRSYRASNGANASQLTLSLR